MSEFAPQNLRFLDQPIDHADPKTSKFIILPMPMEATVSYKRGTRHGPDALIRASHHVEYFDEEHWNEPWEAGIATLEPVDVSGEAPVVFKRAADTVEPFIRNGQFVFTIGGEHALTEGPLSGVARVHKKISVFHIDAHADLRDSYHGSKYNHACAARRMMEYADIVQVGIRSISEDEYHYCNSKTVKTFLRHKHLDNKKLIPKVLDALGDTVYISIDLDGLDPSIMPGVGTPVPGGLGWYETLDLLRAVILNKNVVAADVVELCPLPDEVVSEFTAARLVYRMIGYVVAKASGKKKKKK